MSRPLAPPRHHLAALGFALAFGLTGCDEEGKTATDCPVLDLYDITPAKGGTGGTSTAPASGDCITAVGDAVSPPAITDGGSGGGATAGTAGSGATEAGGGGSGGASAGTGGT